MGLFKSKEKRRMERDLQVRKALNAIRKQVRLLETNEKDYLEKARRAHRLGSSEQLNFLKKAIRRSISQRNMMERQLLAIETAVQMKGQAESYAEFAKAMSAVSKSVSEVFSGMDVAQVQTDFERALEQAETLEQRMDLLLDLSSETMLSGEGATNENIISDKELDALIAHEESGSPTRSSEINRELEQLDRELR